MVRWSLLAVPLACNSPASSETLKPSTPAVKLEQGFEVDVRKAVAYLASDELEGRGVGTQGIDKAADYIADAFRRLGLQPAPGIEGGGYFQTFTITAATAPDPSTALTSGDKAYAIGKDFTVIPFSAESKFDAPVVFAGYGITSKDHGYDDYANLDVKGKVVLALRYEPQDAAGVSRFSKAKGEWSREAALINKARTAANHGAAALLLVNPPTQHGADPAAAAHGAAAAANPHAADRPAANAHAQTPAAAAAADADPLVPFSRDMQGDRSPLPFLHVRRHLAEELLKKAGAKDLAALQAEIDKDGKPLAQPLPNVAAAGQVKILRTDTPVKNVVGVLPGRGDLAGEYVVVGAHYDHLGRGGPGSLTPNLKEIHNGADDNASGVAAMLEIAEHYAKASGDGGAKDARSVVFTAFTAEESGLIGSARFVSHPPVPLDKIAYMLNLDMVGRVRDNVLSVGGTGTAPSFEPLLKQADDASPLTLKTFGKGGFGPSDHMSFALKQIPVLFFWSGTHTDYHRPTDDADKVNYDGIEQVVRMSVRVLDAFRAHAREQYVSASDHSGMSPGGRGGSRVTLGVVPDYGNDADKGVRISGTVPGSPAEAAGLKGGDVITKFGDDPIDSLQGLTNALAGGKAGQKVKVTVRRDGKDVELEATLAERKG